MDFVALVDQVIALLRQRGRVTYRTLQRQFQLDAEALADLLGELRYAHQEALREDEQGLIWTDEAPPRPKQISMVSLITCRYAAMATSCCLHHGDRVVERLGRQLL